MDHPAPASDPRIGIVLQERYRIVRKLGDGGMGAVYEGEHVVIKRRVAIKVLHARFAENPEIVARFHREAEAATSIGHPNIVEVTDMGRFPDGTAYMVLEYLDGRDFAKDIRLEGPQPLGKVVHVLAQVCDALGAAHDKGIVHRDLKPENVFLVERGGDRCFAKVLDFGISKITDAGTESRSLTQTGTALGTPYYMAPEQCQGRKDLDARADIYSLGVILFQALTGQYPFDDESYPMLVLKICTEPAPPLARYRPDLPPAVQTIVARMLAKDRDARFASCAEVKAALAPFRGVHGAPVVIDAPSTASQSPSVLAPRARRAHDAARRSRAPLALAALAVTLLGGAAGLAAAFDVLPGLGGRPPREASAPVEPRASRAARGVGEAARASGARAGASRARPNGERAREDAATVERADAGAVPTVRLHVTVIGPPAADLWIDGSPVGPAPFAGVVERDRALHTIEARAAGWPTVSREVSFDLVEQRIPLRMERERRDRSRARETIVVPPPPPPPPPRPDDPLVPLDTVFQRGRPGAR